MKTNAQKQVLVIGAGFAGLNAVRKLLKDHRVRVTLVDRRNHHLFQPLLYQVATAGLSPADIAMPIRHLFSNHPRLEVLLDEAIDLLPKENKVRFATRELSYDYLVVACGANHSYFGKDHWEEFAPGLKTVEQATEIRRRVLTAFEEAEKEADPIKRKTWMNFVIVGAGPTGVELAGAISELSQKTLRDDFQRIDPSQSEITLIEAGPRVLAAFEPSLSERAKADLEGMGVKVMLQARVTDIDHEGVTLGDQKIESKTIIWAAGVSPSITNQSLLKNGQSIELDRAGRVKVEPDLSLKAHPNVFVLGDQACFLDSNGKPLPGLAPVAMQQGRQAAKNILNRMNEKPTQKFEYLDKGSMATIGRKRAVVQTAGLKFTGFMAWVTWLLIHIYYLIGFKNRLFVFMQWTWSYLTFSRGARLIVGKDWRLKP